MNTAFASTYTVASNGSSANDSDCSTSPSSITLLEAVACANSHPGPDTISIPANGAMGGAITLGGGISVSSGEDLTIIGAGSGSTTITSGGITIVGAGFSLSGVTLAISGTPQAGIAETDPYTGNFSLNDVVMTGTPSIGVYLGADEGFTITGNVSVTNSNIAGDRAGVAIGLGGGGSPTTKLHITGTVDVSDSTFTIAPTDGNGFNAGVAMFSADAGGAVSIDNNVTVQEGTAEGSGFVAMDMADLGTSFGSTVDIVGNSITTGGTDLLGAGVADLIRSVGLTTISGNTVSGGIGENANFAGGVLMADGGCIFGGTCTGQEDLVISNNDIDVSFEGAPSMPVIMAQAETATVNGNTVDLNGEDANGIVCSSFTSTPDCTVNDNVISHVGGQSGIVLTPSFDAQIVNGDIYNNVVWGGTNDAGFGILAASVPMGGPQPAGATINANIFNNSVDGNGHTVGIAAGDMTGDTVLDAVVFNNAVANYNTASSAGIMQIGTSEDVSFAHDHNMVGPSSTNSFVSTPDGMSFSDLSLGTGDVVDDPEFTNAATGDLSIDVTSPAVDTGTSVSNTVSAPSTDFNGDPRPARDAFDIGAFEYQNQSPVTAAGVDQNKYKGASLTDSVTLHCDATDPEGDTPITYAWTRTSGPSSVSFTGASTADASFTPGAVGTYVIRCTATDSLSAPGYDEMNVVVTANTAPSANAGVDQAVHTGDSVTLHCASTDTEEDTITYAWTNVSGPTTPSLATASTADSGFTAAAVGTYVVRCTTGDSYNTSATNDTVSIVVTDANTSPTANAGPDQYTTIGDQVNLTCAASTDPDVGDSLTYHWTQTSGSTVSLSSTSSATPHFTPTTLGNRTFQCQVTDAHAATNTDSVVIHATAQRIAGADRYNTAIALSQSMYSSSHTVSAMVIASGENYPDALASGPLAALIHGPVLLVQKTWAPGEVRTEIARLWNNSDDSATDIYIIGGTSAIQDSVVAQIQAVNSKLDIKRLAGSDRIDTAIKVAQEMDSVRGLNPSNVAVASGYNFNDAAAMAAVGSDSTVNSRYIPVLLNGTGSLDSRVSSYINGKKSSLSKVWAIGSTSAISNSAQTSLNSIVGSSKVTRLSGSDKYGNTTAIASQFYPSAAAVTITVGGNFPDVLAGGPYAASKHAPVLYVSSSSVPSANTTFLDAKASTLNYVYVLGGTTAIPNTVKQTVQQHL